MFERIREEKPSIYDEPIARVLLSMDTYGPDEPEYDDLLKRLQELTKMKAETTKPKFGVSPDTLAIVAGNLAGILIVVMYEHSHVMVSKAKDYALRTR